MIKSLILQATSRFIMTLFIVFSIFLLLRGHNEPGGGFVGGLVAAGAFALHAIAYNAASARRALHFSPHSIIGVGLLTALASGLPALLRGEPFLTGIWTHATLPLLGELDIGTPLVFDVGVYLVVLGVTSGIILNLAEE